MPADKCPRCLLPQPLCLCAEIPTIETRTRVIIIRHYLEKHRSSNSGRLAALALPNSEIVEHGGIGGPATLPSLTGGWVLYPQGAPVTECPEPPPRALIVLDASWSQSRRMFRKLDGLRGLPLLHLPPGPMAPQRMRASPAPGMISTIEAIAAALRLLEGDTAGAALDQLFAVAVARAQATGRVLPQSVDLARSRREH